MHRLVGLGHALGEDLFLLDFRVIGRLNLEGNTSEGVLDRSLSGGDEHLPLDWGSVRSPDDEDELVPVGTVLSLEVVIVNGVTDITRWEVIEEVVVGLAWLSSLLDDDMAEIFAEVEDHIPVLVADLDVVPDGDAVVVNLDSCKSHWLSEVTGTMRPGLTNRARTF